MKDNGKKKKRKNRSADILRPIIFLILAAGILWALTWLNQDAAGPSGESVPGFGQLFGSFFPDIAENESDDGGNAAGSEGNAAGGQTGYAADGAEAAFPAYTGKPFVRIQGDRPFFSEAELEAAAVGSETALSAGNPIFQPLDELGRCGPAMMTAGAETMATEEREPIVEIQPSGWRQAEYDSIGGGYLYHRCHLIGFQLCGISADERNLITGTRHLNITGMQPWEDWVAEYVSRTGRHVLYRVTPVFEEMNTLASGVLLEAEGVEDRTFHFCVYCFNVQPGIRIDYRTGASAEEQYAVPEGQTAGAGSPQEAEPAGDEITPTFILNTNSGKFHRPDCSAAEEIAWRNRIEWIRSREELCELGYTPCGFCRP